MLKRTFAIPLIAASCSSPIVQEAIQVAESQTGQQIEKEVATEVLREAERYVESLGTPSNISKKE